MKSKLEISPLEYIRIDLIRDNGVCDICKKPFLETACYDPLAFGDKKVRCVICVNNDSNDGPNEQLLELRQRICG